MSLKTDLKAALKANKLSMSTFNKKQNKQAKKAALEQVVRAGIAQGYSREKLSKELRTIRINNKKFTFSNEQFRDIYDFASFNKGKVQAGRLRGSAKPRESKLFNLGRSKPTKSYLYVFKVYLDNPKNRAFGAISRDGKKLPKRKSVIRRPYATHYRKTQEIGFYLEKLVNKNRAVEAFFEYVYDVHSTDDNEGVESDLTPIGSDNMGIPSDMEIVAFEYIRVVKDF